MECTRPDISERLAMAVFPEDFPEEQQMIQEHVRDCSSCRKELDMLRSLREILQEHRNELADSVSGCPSPAELVEFTLDESAHSSVQRHIESCCQCKEEVDLVKQLHRESPAADTSSPPSAEEKLIVRNAVLKAYGQPPAKPSSSMATWLESVLSFLHVPSLALGAVAAALLVVMLMPWSAKEMPSRLILSDAKWDKPVPETMTKGTGVFIHAKKVALIILVQDGAGLSPMEVGQLYGKSDFGRSVGAHYEFMSPADVKNALEYLPEQLASVPAAARMVLDRTDADYVLAFRVGGTGSRLSLAGSLFERPQKKLLGFASWDGVARDRLSEKVLLIGRELLSGAEPS